MLNNRLNEVVFETLTKDMSYSQKLRLQIYNQRRHEMIWLACLLSALATFIPGFIFRDPAIKFLLIGFGLAFSFVMVVAIKNQLNNRRIWHEIMQTVHAFEKAFCLNASCRPDLMKGKVYKVLVCCAKEISDMECAIGQAEDQALEEGRLKQVRDEISKTVAVWDRKRKYFTFLFNLVKKCTGNFIDNGYGYRCFFDKARAVSSKDFVIEFAQVVIN